MHRRPCGDPSHQKLTEAAQKKLGLKLDETGEYSPPDSKSDSYLQKYFPVFVKLRTQFSSFFPD
jgi:hypothetical protein